MRNFLIIVDEQYDVFGGVTLLAFMQRNGPEEVKAAVMHFLLSQPIVLHIAKPGVCFKKIGPIQVVRQASFQSNHASTFCP
jgi:hypothetical protein